MLDNILSAASDEVSWSVYGIEFYVFINSMLRGVLGFSEFLCLSLFSLSQDNNSIHLGGSFQGIVDMSPKIPLLLHTAKNLSIN
eukprot:g30931.t1